METGAAIVNHQLPEEELAAILKERMKKLAMRHQDRFPESQLLLDGFIPDFEVASYRFRRVGNFSTLMVQGNRSDDTDDHIRIWVESAKRNKHDKPNLVRAAEICLNRVAEDILLNKPLN